MAVNYGELEVNTTLDGTIDGEIQEGAGEGTTNYNYLINKPSINDVELKGNKSLEDLGIATSLADLADDEEHRTVSDEEKTAWNNKSDFSGDYNDLRNKPDIPTKLSDLEEDSAHQTITNAERANWNQKADRNEVPDSLSDLDDDQYHRLVTDVEKTTWNNKPDEVSELDDVNISNLQNGQVLKYDSVSGKFVNANESGGIANAYAKIKVADTLIEASGEDTIELVAGSNVTLTPDRTNKKIAISATGGGGTSTGDMLKEIYDTNNDGIVNAADKATTLDGLESSITELNYLKDATGNIQQQLNSKSEFSGSYNDLTDKPTIPDAQIQSDWNQSDNSKKDYIKNKPTIPDELADLSDDSTHRLVTDTEKTTWNNKSDFSGSYNDLTDKPTIPDELADLSDDSTHRLVTDTEKSTWDAKSDFSGSYNDLTDKPTIPDPQIQADWNQTDNTSADFIKNKPTIPSGQIQSDWNQTTSSEVDYIKNKPTLGTASSLNVASTGDAGSNEVVKGNDSRLTDARTPVSHTHTLSDITNAGTAAAKDSTSSVTAGSTDLVESGAVKTAIDNAIASAYKHAGTKTCAELVSSLLVAANVGHEYNITDSGTTTADFMEGAGHPINAGDNVGIAEVSEGVYKFDLLSGFIDTSNFVEKSSTSGLIKNDGTIDTTEYAPTSSLGTAASKNVPTSGNASSSEVVMGNDSRLTDARSASDVYDWAKAATKPSYTKGEIGLGNVDNTSDATKKTNFTGSIASGNTNFVTGGDAYTALNNKVDKVNGKGLSTNDYTTTEKDKLAGIATNATKVESSETNGNIKINGTETQVYDDSDIQDVITEDTTTVTGNPLSFNTLSAQRASQAEILLNPIQNLHGFDKPWTGGAGKNKLPITVASVKAGNTSGTWSGNVYTLNNVTFTLLTDSDGNLVGIKTNGTASAQTRLLLTFELSANSYTITGTPSTGSSTTYRQIIYNNTTASYIAYDNNAGATFTLNANSSLSYIIQILQDINPNNAIFYPMIRLSSETDATYAPYTNYASISGRTEIGIEGCGVNIWDEEWEVGSYDITTGAKSTDNTRIRNKNKIPIKSNTAYCFSTQTSRIPTILWYDKYENFISITSNSASSAFVTTSPTNAQYACFFGTTTYGTTYNNDICVNISDSSFDGQYIPHISSNDITISFGTTVYSGTLNVLKGELVVDKGYLADLSQLTWNKRNTVTNKWEFYVALTSMKLPQSSDYYADMNCSIYKIITANQAYNGNNGIGIACGTNAGNATLFVYDNTISELTDFQNAISGVQLTYELANPITIQLTPYQVSLLKDANYITTTGDSITLTYRDGTMATLGDLVNIPTKLSELYNDNNTVMDADYVHTDNNYTTSDKTKVSSVSTGATKTESSTTNGNIKIDGTETQVYNDSEIQGKLTTDTTTSTGNPINFTIKTAQNAVSTIIDLEPIQDLHGYDKPWVGGAGKNKLYTDLANIKAVNINGAWNENVYTYDSMTFTVLQDSNDNIVGIKVSGTNNLSADLNFFITNRNTGTAFYLPTNTYNLNGCPANGSDNTYQMRFQCTRNGSLHSFGVDNGNGLSNVAVLNTDRLQVVINIKSGVSVSNKIFYPMIYLSTETDPSFAPYTNYASISGRTEIGIEGCGKNLLPMTVDSLKTINGGTWTGNSIVINNVTFTILADNNGNVAGIKANGQANANTYFLLSNDFDSTENAGRYINGLPSTGSASSYRFRIASQSDWTALGDIDVNDSIMTDVGSGLRLAIRISINYNCNNLIFYPMIRITTDTNTYEPYTKSNDLLIQFGETVYGGSLDVEKGVLTVDRVTETFDGSNDETWYLESSGTNNFFYAIISNAKNSSADGNHISNEFEHIGVGSSNTNIGFWIVDNIRLRVRYKYDNTLTVSDLRTWLSSNNLEACYELATPITIQLTPHQISLLKGVNNISVSDDYSTITLTYRSGEVATLGDLKEAIDGGEYHIYSTEERVVAKWIDGRPVYEKVVFFGEIPNGVSKEVAHNIDNFYTAITISGVGRNSSTGEINFAQQRDGASIWMTPTSIGTWGTRNWDGIDFYFYVTYVKDE